MTRPILGFAVGIAFLYAVIAQLVNQIVDQPYMDEIFHFDQTRAYCVGNFAYWNTKITTFPGLYYFATLFAYISSALNVFRIDDVCSLTNFRHTNLWFAVALASLLPRLRLLCAPSEQHVLLHSAVLLTFPVLFFCTFLFYTEVGSMYFVLLMYYLAECVDFEKQKRAGFTFLPSALCGALAVFFRQNNIIWVGFVAGTTLVRFLEAEHASFIYSSSDAVLSRAIRVAHAEIFSLLIYLWPFAGVIICFIVFVLQNGSIVLGDKSNHEMSFHAAQLLYFTFAIASGFSTSLFLSGHLYQFWCFISNQCSTRTKIYRTTAILSIALIVIAYCSPVHPFMLADNRHYTFYIWRKFFRRYSMAKFAPLPVYTYFGWFGFRELGNTRSPLWILVYFVAVCLSLIPSPLVEPRYYIVPAIVFHVNTAKQRKQQMYSTLVLYSAINLVTMIVFLQYPFLWVDGSTGRFMW
uniref:Dol-P-Glc:Glc(2)Man(9)GlcNAc(2)-PP-Dol alpha-1,2-glucosyltransferase n=1 Tax=Albugo laibachii Nc14 TaxID=890382 RepID=F0WNL1_9STRA|nr:alpha1 putative [Albugo laibachii Nc14]|eukprot:CCA22902.1 alpha1 putative [Albugo laibachii Nc14]